MNSYDYNSLKAAAEEADVWIDVRDNKVLRAHGKGNTNKKERVSRSLSWYAKSESAATPDERLIFSYIAFNALYAQDKRNAHGKDAVYRSEFIGMLANSDYARLIVDFAHARIEELRKILSLQHLSEKYWNHTGDMKKAKLDQQKEKQDAHRVKKALIVPGKFYFLKYAMSKIALLRNQVMHGMAAYEDSYNRTQIKLCADFLHDFTGRVIAAVIHDSSKTKWGKVSYPPQGSPDVSSLEIKELED